jgi:hypothetical protein
LPGVLAWVSGDLQSTSDGAAKLVVCLALVPDTGGVSFHGRARVFFLAGPRLAPGPVPIRGGILFLFDGGGGGGSRSIRSVSALSTSSKSMEE